MVDQINFDDLEPTQVKISELSNISQDAIFEIVKDLLCFGAAVIHISDE